MTGIDPELLADSRMRAVLAERDVAGVYRLLTRHGISQREIAAATGQSQSEISEILKGRQVQAYDVLVRICEGPGIPREAMGCRLVHILWTALTLRRAGRTLKTCCAGSFRIFSPWLA